MPVLRLCLILVLFATGSPAAASDAPSPSRTERATTAMEQLASVGIEQALKAIGNAGTFYPFAFLRTSDGQVSLMGYEGPAEKAPDADAFAASLYRQIRRLIGSNPNIEAAAIFRMHRATDVTDGDQVPGIWCLVDHRDRAAMVVFQPLVEQEDQPGRYTLGELVYQAAPDPIFPVAGRRPDK